eukprot:TRINITY_DN5962_c0_g1_i2.p4 TRINITY_DN5962_c0_g1~~TRINITY_DN5962_c0_g1_i2.p4  ORF type:complete len:271 (+),score=-5.92 TRINITY_DN5962_c0_g1_i2:479-1291(+)
MFQYELGYVRRLVINFQLFIKGIGTRKMCKTFQQFWQGKRKLGRKLDWNCRGSSTGKTKLVVKILGAVCVLWSQLTLINAFQILQVEIRRLYMYRYIDIGYPIIGVGTGISKSQTKKKPFILKIKVNNKLFLADTSIRKKQQQLNLDLVYYLVFVCTYCFKNQSMDQLEIYLRFKHRLFNTLLIGIIFQQLQYCVRVLSYKYTINIATYVIYLLALLPSIFIITSQEIQSARQQHVVCIQYTWSCQDKKLFLAYYIISKILGRQRFSCTH